MLPLLLLSLKRSMCPCGFVQSIIVSFAPVVGQFKWTVSPFTAVMCCHLARETENNKKKNCHFREERQRSTLLHKNGLNICLCILTVERYSPPSKTDVLVYFLWHHKGQIHRCFITHFLKQTREEKNELLQSSEKCVTTKLERLYLSHVCVTQ